jgi:hypothetical protein
MNCKILAIELLLYRKCMALASPYLNILLQSFVVESPCYL